MSACRKDNNWEMHAYMFGWSGHTVYWRQGKLRGNHRFLESTVYREKFHQGCTLSYPYLNIGGSPTNNEGIYFWVDLLESGWGVWYQMMKKLLKLPSTKRMHTPHSHCWPTPSSLTRELWNLKFPLLHPNITCLAFYILNAKSRQKSCQGPLSA